MTRLRTRTVCSSPFLSAEPTPTHSDRSWHRRERGNPSFIIHLPDGIGGSIPPSTAHAASAAFSPSGGGAIESIPDSRDGGVDGPPTIPASSGSRDNKGEPAGIGRPDRTRIEQRSSRVRSTDQISGSASLPCQATNLYRFEAPERFWAGIIEILDSNQ